MAEAGARQATELAYFPLWSYAHPKAIELAVLVVDVRPGTAHDHGDVAVRVGGHAGEVQPEIALGGVLFVADGVRGCHLVPHE